MYVAPECKKCVTWPWLRPFVVVCHSKINTWYDSVQNLKTLASAISEIWRKTQIVKIGVIWVDWGHSRSLAMSPFSHSTYSPFTETIHLSCTVLEIQWVISQKSQAFPTYVHLWPPLAVTSLEFHHDLSHCGLSKGIVCVVICLAGL